MLKTRNQWLAGPVGVVAASALVYLGLVARTSAVPGRESVPPTSVASVDLARLIDRLDEAKDKSKEIKAKAEEADTAMAAKASKLKDLENDIKVSADPNDTATLESKRLEFAKLKKDYETEGEMHNRELGSMKGRMIGDLFTKASAAITDLAKRDGYQLVVTDDRSVNSLEHVPSPQIPAAVLDRRVLYADPSIDITDRLVTIMNNDYRAGVKPAATPDSGGNSGTAPTTPASPAPSPK